MTCGSEQIVRTPDPPPLRWVLSLTVAWHPLKRIAFIFALLVCSTAIGCRSGKDSPPTLQQLTLYGDLQKQAALIETPVTVGTYNLHWLRDKPGLRNLLRRLPQVNIWCFQEVRAPGDDDTALVADLAHILPPGPWHVVVARVNRLREIGSSDWESQAIASRFPIRDAAIWPVDETGAKRRLALTALMNVPGLPLRVVNVDHEPSYLGWRDRNAAQVRALVERLAATPDDRVVVAGDFNASGNLWRGYGTSSHGGRIHRSMAALGFVPVEVAKPTFRAWPLVLRIDRIYVRGLRVTDQGVEDRPRGSDHFPVWCTLAP